MTKKKNNNNVLALDLATKMGYYVHATPPAKDRNPHSVSFKNRNTRELEFYEFITALIERYDIQTVVYEDACFQRKGAAQHLFGTWTGILKLICLQKGIHLDKVGVTQIKKCFTGNGEAEKSDMIERCLKFGIDVGKDDDAADAFAVFYTWNTLNNLTVRINV